MSNETTEDNVVTSTQAKILKSLETRPWLWRSMLYLALLIIATVVFATIRFPSGELTPIVNHAMRQAPVHLETKTAELSFPPGLILRDVSVALIQHPQDTIATASTVKVKPYFLAALMGGLKAGIKAQTLDGVVEALVEAENRGGGDSELSLMFRGINPGKAQWWESFPWFKVEGKLGGEGELEVKRADVKKAQGWLKAQTRQARLAIGEKLNPDGGVIDVSMGELEFKLEKGKLTVVKGSAAGPHFSATISGGITLANNLNNSILNLIITLSLAEPAKKALGTAALFLPQPGSNGKTIIRIGGTIKSPAIR
ncbi:MAG: type II secretion system protein GspN [Nitrospinota bacterium]|nr:type II secretion system protein GspN [Nitrospinota bacterium]